MITGQKGGMKLSLYLHVGGILLACVVALSMWHPLAMAQSEKVPQFKVDPYWPKPLPAPIDADGLEHQWVTGEPGATCVDSHDNIFTYNRGWQQGSLGKLLPTEEGTQSIPAPAVIEFDPEGNIVSTWGDSTIAPVPPGATYGAAAVLPESAHGCFVDYEDNVWLSGNGDGVVQKWTHDGKKMLLQIGTKGLCDGPPTLSPKTPYPTCGSPGYNSSHTLLDEPAGLAIDPRPDPITGKVGDVYIADGYGNHRVVVFDSAGKYLRQMGSEGSGPGQFAVPGGGHPHCVTLGNDNLVYACDRGNARIEVFDKTGSFVKSIPVNPPMEMKAILRVNVMQFSRDKEQMWMYVTDVGSGSVWIMNHATGQIAGRIGHIGHMAGEFTAPHTMAVDSKGNIYVSEALNGGRRTQKFVLQH